MNSYIFCFKNSTAVFSSTLAYATGSRVGASFSARYCVKLFFVSFSAKTTFVSKCPNLFLSCFLIWIESPTRCVILVYDFKDEAT